MTAAPYAEIATVHLDWRGLSCPEPILKTAKAARVLKQTRGGGILEVVADDDTFPTDLKSWCRSANAELLSLERASGGAWAATIRVPPPASPTKRPRRPQESQRSSESDRAVLDCRAIYSPGPIVQVARFIRELPDHVIFVEVLADDPSFPMDIETWCRGAGASLVKFDKEGKHFCALVRRPSQRSSSTNLEQHASLTRPAYNAGPRTRSKRSSGVEDSNQRRRAPEPSMSRGQMKRPGVSRAGMSVRSARHENRKSKRKPKKEKGPDRIPPRSRSVRTSPRSRSLHDSSPRSRSLHDSSPRSRSVKESSPRSRSLHDSSPRSRSVKESSPRSRSLRDESPRSRSLHDGSPRSRSARDSSPRSRSLRDSSPRSGAIRSNQIPPRSRSVNKNKPSRLSQPLSSSVKAIPRSKPNLSRSEIAPSANTIRVDMRTLSAEKRRVRLAALDHMSWEDTIIEIQSDHAEFSAEIAAWCTERGHKLLGFDSSGPLQRAIVEPSATSILEEEGFEPINSAEMPSIKAQRESKLSKALKKAQEEKAKAASIEDEDEDDFDEGEEFSIDLGGLEDDDEDDDDWSESIDVSIDEDEDEETDDTQDDADEEISEEVDEDEVAQVSEEVAEAVEPSQEQQLPVAAGQLQTGKRCALLVLHNDHEALLAALMVASESASVGMDVTVFFSFWAMDLLRKDQPRPSLFARFIAWLTGRNIDPKRMLGTTKMNREQLILAASEQGVKFVACTNTMSSMGMDDNTLLPIPDLEYRELNAFSTGASGADVQLVF